MRNRRKPKGGGWAFQGMGFSRDILNESGWDDNNCKFKFDNDS